MMNDGLVLDAALSRYLLVAECINCKVPITKNGACNHMTCTRCNAEFCWICRKPYRGHKQPGPYNITFQLGCEVLAGDTAISWLLIMLLIFIFSPFHTFVEISIMLGQAMRKGFVEEIADNKMREPRSKEVVSVFLMGLSLLPVILAMFCLIYPLVVVCRLW